MSQVFQRRTELAVKLWLAGLLVLAIAAAAWLVSLGRHGSGEEAAVAQPIPFSHKHHVGDVGLDCRYCHTSVETSAFAGLPSTTTCLTCHSQLFAGAAVLEPLRRSAATGLPIAWNRVDTLPDFVYFNHGIHVAKGVACSECHGRVDQMPLTWRTAPLEMQWCLACHRDPGPHLRPQGAVFSMDAARPQRAETARLLDAAHLQSTRRLTDCSTCHR
jgi:cytochrome c7-like protein